MGDDQQVKRLDLGDSCDLLNEAKQILLGRGSEEYGDLRENLARMAVLFEILTGVTLTMEQVSCFPICLKLIRISEGRAKRDTLVDLAAYVAGKYMADETEQPAQSN